MEYNPNLQADDDDDQSNGTVGDPNAVKVLGILTDPPKGTPGGGIELEQEGDEEEKENIGKGGGGREEEGVVRGDVEEKGKEEQIEGVKAGVEMTQNEIIIGDLSAVELGLVLGLEGGETGDGVEPIEEAVEGHEIVRRSVGDAEGGDGGPGEEG